MSLGGPPESEVGGIGFTLDNPVGIHDVCKGKLYLQDNGSTYCYKCDEVVRA